MTIIIRKATSDDARRLAPNLRKEDRDECLAGSGDPSVTLPQSVLASHRAFAIMSHDEPIGIFGWIRDSDGAARVWMLGSDALTSGPNVRLFLRESREWVELLNERFPVLWNLIDSRNSLHIRWLRWLGFTFINRVAAGPQGLTFFTFVRIKPCVTPSP